MYVKAQMAQLPGALTCAELPETDSSLCRVSDDVFRISRLEFFLYYCLSSLGAISWNVAFCPLAQLAVFRYPSFSTGKWQHLFRVVVLELLTFISGSRSHTLYIKCHRGRTRLVSLFLSCLDCCFVSTLLPFYTTTLTLF